MRLPRRWARSLGLWGFVFAAVTAALVACGNETTVAKARGTWEAMAPMPLTPRSGASAVWTGSKVLVWGGAEIIDDETGSGFKELGDGAAYDPVTDSWSPIASAKQGRYEHAAFWTGSQMLVIGGSNSNVDLNSVAIYDPASDRWRSAAPSPLRLAQFWAVWTGRQLLVWGESDDATQGAAYDPAADRWRPISPGPLEPRINFVMVWAGERMLVWGGGTGPLDRLFADGAAYDPVTDTWRLLARAPLSARILPLGINATWTGSKLLVWGGGGRYLVSDGAAYDPAGDKWSQIATAPEGLVFGTSVWTGRTMIVSGGIAVDRDENPVPRGGAAYDPKADRWSRLPPSPAPPVVRPAAAWTGTELVVVGGDDAGSPPNDLPRPSGAVARFRPRP